MGYLEPGEYAAFGLGAETAGAWVAAASAMIEAHCRRPSLLAASYTERVRLRPEVQRMRLSYAPLITVDAVKARYTRSREGAGALEATFAAAFGLPGQWVDLDVSTLGVSVAIGEVELPWNVMGLQFGEAEVTYTAGLVTVPDAVKVACAQMVKNAQATPGLNVRSSKMDALQVQYFSDSLIDSQVRALLRPFVAERLG